MILFNTCSIIDAHPYPERKQNNFYHNIKPEIHRKKIRSFQHHNLHLLILYKGYQWVQL